MPLRRMVGPAEAVAAKKAILQTPRGGVVRGLMLGMVPANSIGMRFELLSLVDGRTYHINPKEFGKLLHLARLNGWMLLAGS